MNKLQELKEELLLVFSGRGSRLLDSLLPLLAFIALNLITNLNIALWAALSTAGFLLLYRLIRGQSLAYSIGGFAAVLLAALLAWLSRSEASFYLPGFISGAVTAGICLLSALINRPLAAWSSYITRRWPLEWYWQPQVLPAYREVTYVWAAAFFGRLAVQYWLYRQGALAALGAAQIILGWPFIILVLVSSYLYGLRRLQKLGGPSVQEFKNNAPPPWSGQRRGF